MRRQTVSWLLGLLTSLAVALCPNALGARASEPLTAGQTRLEAGAIADSARVRVESWRFRPGDRPEWATREISDGDWTVVPPWLFRRGEPLPADWRGIGWLRAELWVDEELVGRPLALILSGHGAAEVFLEGSRVAAVGTPTPSPATTVPRLQRLPDLVVFARPGAHLLAVRFANHEVARYLLGRATIGVSVSFAEARSGVAEALRFQQFYNRSFGWFTGVFLAFALLHLLLFVFYPALRANLDFALFCLATAALVCLMTYRHVQSDPRFYLFFEPAMSLVGLAFGATALRFGYRLFYERAPRFLGVYLVLALPVAAWSLIDTVASVNFVFLLMLAASVELVRVVIVAQVRRKPGARLVGVGALALAFGFALGLLANLGFLPATAWTNFLVPFSSVMVLLVMMSIHLSRRFAAVHGDLEARLVEVRQLAAEKLEQERLRRHEEVERRVLETRYQEKVRELEEARELQLSMLPSEVPATAGLEIAAHMETATEVGGDYYDFRLCDDGALLVAIGDATGHGMRAGTMVTATKSLFNALAHEHPLVETLGKSTKVLKSLNLPRLTMALTLARYRDGELVLAAAGMPPALVYRAAGGAVEQVLLAGMPLGAVARFPYRQATLRLAPGDTVLLMSDGFPERLDPADEMLGYERASSAFSAAAAARPVGPAAVVEQLRRVAGEWAAGRALDDDMTFVVLKVREDPPLVAS